MYKLGGQQFRLERGIHFAETLKLSPRRGLRTPRSEKTDMLEVIAIGIAFRWHDDHISNDQRTMQGIAQFFVHDKHPITKKRKGRNNRQSVDHSSPRV
jgi:hypothetical protein